MPSKTRRRVGDWILILTITVFVPMIASASTITVNTTVDNATGGDGNCSLREAITNADSNSETTSGDCVAGSGVDRITFSVSGTILLGSTLPDVTDTGALTIDGSGQPITISGNNSVRVMVVSPGATLNLEAVTIANGDGFNGGGVAVGQGTLNIANSTLSGNTAFFGGAISVGEGTLNVTNSTFSGNTAEGAGGGAIDNNNGTLNVTNSTFFGNSSQGSSGGAISNLRTLNITNSTFSGNSASSGGVINNGASGTLRLLNTIIADSNGSDCSNSGVIAANTNNLIEDGTCTPDFTGDPMLDLLAGNGGPTQTMALQSGSPAIDAGDETTCESAPVNNLDQRSFLRPIDGDADNNAICDIGAFEFGSHASSIEPAIDIKFCSNPNAFNCKKKGVLPVTVFGTAEFDVRQIKLNTLQLCLANDTSSCVQLVDAQFPRDRGNPQTDLGSNACTDEVANPDGFDDIDVLFDAREVASLIECGPLSKGNSSPALIIQGELNDGTEFQSTAQNDVGIDELLIQHK